METIEQHLRAIIKAYRSDYLLDVKVQLAESFLLHSEKKVWIEEAAPFTQESFDSYVPSEAKPLDSETRKENSRIANKTTNHPISFEDHPVPQLGFPMPSSATPHLGDFKEYIERELTAKVDAELKRRSDARLRSSILRKTEQATKKNIELVKKSKSGNAKN